VVNTNDVCVHQRRNLTDYATLIRAGDASLSNGCRWFESSRWHFMSRCSSVVERSKHHQLARIKRNVLRAGCGRFSVCRRVQAPQSCRKTRSGADCNNLPAKKSQGYFREEGGLQNRSAGFESSYPCYRMETIRLDQELVPKTSSG